MVGPVIAALRAAGETTRLRLLNVLAGNDLTVTDLTQILGQSQPRVSRHLKLLAEAGLIDRFREGTWVFYRLAEPVRGEPNETARLASFLVDILPDDDPEMQRDLTRLQEIKAARADAAAGYFRENAAQWNAIRALHISEGEIEAAIHAALGEDQVGSLLDLGTGTGRLLEALADRFESGVGIDQSREMLNVARTNLEKANIRHAHVRYADIFGLPFAPRSFDAVTVHHVLHFLEDPAAAVHAAASMVKEGGRLIIADFAKHDLDYLREKYAHRRLGFAEDEIADWLTSAGLEEIEVRHLRSDDAPRRPEEALDVLLLVAQRKIHQPVSRDLELTS